MERHRRDRQVIAAGTGLLAVGLVAFMQKPALGLVALALPILPLFVLKPQTAVLLLMAALPFDAVASLGSPGSFTLTRLLAAGVSGGWAVNLLMRRKPVVMDRPGYVLLGFVAFGTLSLGWAISSGTTRASLLTMGPLCGMYLMLSNLLRSPRLLGRAVDVWLGSTAIVAMIVIFQFSSMGALERASLQFGTLAFNPNYLAAALLLPALIAFARGPARGVFSWWRSATLVPIAIAVVLTGSRAGFLALACGVLAIGTIRPRLALKGVLAVVPLVALVALLYPNRLAHIRERFSAVGQDRMSGRLDIWRVGMTMVADRPLLGVGLGNFAPAFDAYMSETNMDIMYAHYVAKFPGLISSHNTYLTAAGELGIIGAALFCAVLAAHVWGVLARIRNSRRCGDRECHDLALAVLGALGCMLVCGVSLDLFLFKPMWITLALAHAVALMQPPLERSPRRGARSP